MMLRHGVVVLTIVSGRGWHERFDRSGGGADRCVDRHRRRLAAMLAAEGAAVVLTARREAELGRVAEGIRREGGVAVQLVTDLADDDALARLLVTTRAEPGPIDVLVNNAGYAVWKPLQETALDEWDHTFAVNVRAAAYLCANVLPDMRARRCGRIINLGSEAGVAIVPGLAAYCVSKHALGAPTQVIQDGTTTAGSRPGSSAPASSTPTWVMSSPAPTPPTSCRSPTSWTSSGFCCAAAIT
jgi:NADP-dependent 3-hydroxy acid dehydrogenase YdfG